MSSATPHKTLHLSKGRAEGNRRQQPANIEMFGSSKIKSPIVLLSGSSSAAREIAAYYSQHFPDGGLCIVEERPPNKTRLLQFIKRRVRTHGWVSVADAIAARLIQALVHRLFARRLVAEINPDLIVSSCNDPKFSHFLAEVNARLVILNLCSVVSAAQLTAIGRPVINVHPGINPRYRGAGNVWAISEGRFDLVGATIHYVDVGIDTGPVIAYAPIDPVEMNLGVEDTFIASQRAGADLAIEIVNGGNPPPLPAAFINLPSRYYPYPGLSTWLRASFNLKRAQWRR